MPDEYDWLLGLLVDWDKQIYIDTETMDIGALADLTDDERAFLVYLDT